MENHRQRLNLVDFQKRLNESLEVEVDEQTQTEDLMIGFESGQKKWLISLGHLHEVESIPSEDKVHSLKLTKVWVKGIVNFKGTIYTLIDFQLLLGKNISKRGIEARVLLLNTQHESQAAFIVNEVYGLIRPSDLELMSSDLKEHWVSEQYKDRHGEIWNRLNLKNLLEDPEFVNILRE